MPTDIYTGPLAPCPFCGGENIHLWCSGGTWNTTCGSWLYQGCGARSGLADTAEEAAARWNRRLLARVEAQESEVAGPRQEIAAMQDAP